MFYFSVVYWFINSGMYISKFIHFFLGVCVCRCVQCSGFWPFPPTVYRCKSIRYVNGIHKKDKFMFRRITLRLCQLLPTFGVFVVVLVFGPLQTWNFMCCCEHMPEKCLLRCNLLQKYISRSSFRNVRSKKGWDGTSFTDCGNSCLVGKWFPTTRRDTYIWSLKST